jgi:hypothetical protein
MTASPLSAQTEKRQNNPAAKHAFELGRVAEEAGCGSGSAQQAEMGRKSRKNRSARALAVHDDVASMLS